MGAIMIFASQATWSKAAFSGISCEGLRPRVDMRSFAFWSQNNEMWNRSQ